MARVRDVLLDDTLAILDTLVVAEPPLHIYVNMKPGRVEGVGTGVYYYHPAMHRLVQLSSWPDLELGVDNPGADYRMFDGAAFSLFFVAPLDALDPMYHDQYMHRATLKAEALGQVLASAAFSGQICFHPIPTVDFERIRHLFALEDGHVLVRSLLGGPVDSCTLVAMDDMAVQQEGSRQC
jgi:hypothetical protein